MGLILRALALAAAAALLGASPLYAHSGEPLAPHDLWQAWNGNPVLLLALVLAGWWYGRGLAALWRQVGPGRVIGKGQVAAFYGGLACVYLALLSPIDPLSEVLLMAHMVQHLLLMLAAAPLLVLGAPLLAWLWAVPPRWRRRIVRGWRRRRPLAWTIDLVTHPLTVWLLAAGALWVWHTPALYTAALRDPLLHMLEHACLFGTALLFWWVLVEGRRWGAAGAGAKMIFVFTAALQSGPLGILMTVAPQPWYPHYEATAPAWGLTALVDQQLAGTIMSIPMVLIYLGALLALVAPQLREAEHPPILALAVLVAAGGLLVGCIPMAAGADSALVPGGDAARGAAAIRAYGCDACHTIPGIASARSTVGPPLDDWADRHYIAGALPNSPANLIRWIRFPQAVEPGTVMPDLGVTEADARDMSAYLYTLRRD